jgi:hypothetical protein
MSGRAEMNRTGKAIVALSLSTMTLLLVSSLTGIVRDQGGEPYAFTALTGEEIEIYGGRGLYRHDSTYKAVMFRGFDWVNVALVVPLFVMALGLYRRGRLRGKLLLAALFTYLAYIYLIGVMGNAYNAMFLVWTALFSLGLFGLPLILVDLNISSLPARLEDCFPRRTVSIYVVAVGLILLVQYLAEIVSGYVAGKPPVSLDHYTTLELASLELGIMIPLHIAGGVLLWRERAWGYVLATVLAFAAAMVFIALSVALVLFRVSFGRGDVVDLAITAAIAIVAIGFSVAIFREVNE